MLVCSPPQRSHSTHKWSPELWLNLLEYQLKFLMLRPVTSQLGCGYTANSASGGTRLLPRAASTDYMQHICIQDVSAAGCRTSWVQKYNSPQISNYNKGTHPRKPQRQPIGSVFKIWFPCRVHWSNSHP